ncbi:EF-hand domain-containing protein, partial [Salinicola sp. CPA57]|uniref:EF-hand domain-containing protein n=1 Tax=Salinicola sp. CPA57 TaxID=1949080 RepID=UPI0018E503D9
GGSPGMDLQESQAQFARQLVLAQEGDRSALESITQYADQYLSAGQNYYGSGTGYQSIRDDVLATLEDMPDQVSAEEYIADEIKRALADAVDKLPNGIAGALHPMFDQIDTSLDGLIDYGEFSKFFDGLASDERLRQIFSQLDTDGDGQISALEAVKQSTDQVGDNTGSLEERSLEQLQKLTGLTSEMARSTDQFIGLNSTMVSLRESINALGVAQKEAARIEKARQEAEAAAKERVALERKLSGYESTLDSLNSKLGSTQSDIKDLAKDRDTYDYVDYRNEHAADQWSNIDKTYKGYTGYIGDENAYWEDGKLKTSG